MEVLKAILLGIIQGLAEFLPVSSSGHIELGKALFNIDFGENNLTFSVLVHGATVLSTIIIFRKDILQLLKGLFQFKWNEETKFVSFIIISMLPVLVIGLFFKDFVESFFEGKIAFVGAMLILTGILLFLTTIIKRETSTLSPVKSFIIGIAQAIAVLPGISRSGATIATGLMLGIEKSKMARFSFLMVIPPILGAMLLDIKDIASGEVVLSTPFIVLAAGFVAAFLTGLVACQLMIKIVKQGKIQYFAYYCFAVGIIAIIAQFV